MKIEAILLLCVAATAIGAPTAPITDTPTTSPPTTKSPKQLAQNVTQTVMASAQSATILLNQVENVILAEYEIPPTTPCFQEERDPSTYEHPHPGTNFQDNLVQDYISLLRNKDYFKNVTEANTKQKKETTAKSGQSTPQPSPIAIYSIELSDFTDSLTALVQQMETLLNALSPSAVDTAKETTDAPLPSDCYETCYGQQVSALRDYITLVQHYIPSDIGGLVDSKKI